MARTLNRRTFAISTAAVAAGTALLPGARSVTAQGSGVAFDYWHRSGGTAGEAFNTLAETFNAENPDGHTVTAINQGGISELNQKIRAAAAGGGMPGATMGDDYDIAQYAAADIIVDLDPFLSDPDHGYTDDEIAAFLPDQIDRHKLPLYDDRRMAMPQAFSGFATWWNADALSAAGFEAPVATWQEFPDFARRLVESEPNMIPWVESSPGDRFISVMKTYGVEWLKDDGKTANFDAPEVLEIMTWWKECYDEGLLQFTQGDPSEMFAAGETFLFMGSSAYLNGLSEAEFTFNAGLPPQGMDNPVPRTETYGPINAIPANDQEIQEAGWAWLKFLTTPEAYGVWVPGTSYFPAVPGVAESDELSWYYDENPVAQKLLEEVAPAASILALHPALTEVRGQTTPSVVDEVMLGRLSPEDGVMKLQAEATDAIERASAGA